MSGVNYLLQVNNSHCTVF